MSERIQFARGHFLAPIEPPKKGWTPAEREASAACRAEFSARMSSHGCCQDESGVSESDARRATILVVVAMLMLATLVVAWVTSSPAPQHGGAR